MFVSSCVLFNGFDFGVISIGTHYILVSDIAMFVLKRDDKLQLTHYILKLLSWNHLRLISSIMPLV